MEEGRGGATGRLVEARDLVIGDRDLGFGVDGVDKTTQAGTADDADLGGGELGGQLGADKVRGGAGLGVDGGGHGEGVSGGERLTGEMVESWEVRRGVSGVEVVYIRACRAREGGFGGGRRCAWFRV